MSTSTHPPIGSSDHLVVESVLSLKNPKKTVYHYKKIWCYDKADISKLINDLQNAEWNNLIEAPNVDSATDFWNKTFLSLVNKHVPSKKLRSLKPKLPWITIREEQEIKLKHSLFRKYKNSGLQEGQGSLSTSKEQSHATPAESRKKLHYYPFPIFPVDILRHSFLVLYKISDRQNSTPTDTQSYHRCWNDSTKMTWTKQNAFNMFFSRSRQTFSGINLQTHLIYRRMRKSFHFYVLHHRKSTTSWWVCQRKKHLDATGLQLIFYDYALLVLQKV